MIDAIYRVCLDETSRNPIDILEKMMAMSMIIKKENYLVNSSLFFMKLIVLFISNIP